MWHPDLFLYIYCNTMKEQVDLISVLLQLLLNEMLDKKTPEKIKLNFENATEQQFVFVIYKALNYVSHNYQICWLSLRSHR